MFNHFFRFRKKKIVRDHIVPSDHFFVYEMTKPNMNYEHDGE